MRTREYRGENYFGWIDTVWNKKLRRNEEILLLSTHSKVELAKENIKRCKA